MSIAPEVENKIKNELLLKPLNSPEELRNWMFIFLDILFPMGTVYPNSTHSPVEAMWRIYELMKTGDSENIPQVCMLASRDSYKTLGASAIEVLCMLHFRISIAHMAAISSQSEKAIQYVNNFFRKLKPHLEANGWKNISDSKKMIRWLTEEGEDVYLRIVIATIAGANCVKGDTKLRTNLGAMRASDLFKMLEQKKDVKLMSYNHSSQLTEYKNIKNHWKKKHKDLYKIKTTKGTMEVSGDHKLFIEGVGYIKAKDLKTGMKVLRKKGDRSYKNHGKRLNIKSISLKVKQYESKIKLISNSYKNNSELLMFECKEHGEFSKSWAKCVRNMQNHSSLCPKCNKEKNIKNQKLTLNKIKNHIKNNEFAFIDISNYTNAHDSKLKLKCKDDHTFIMSVNNFRNNPRCTKCSAVSSNVQKEVFEFIKKNYNKEIIYNTKNIISPMELDIYISDLKLGIEIDGLYWHSTKVKETPKQDNFKKKELCNAKGIDLLVIYEDEWKNPEKNKLIKAMIKHRLGLLPNRKIRASKLEILKLNKNKDFKVFFEKFHIDGHAQASFAYGLFFEGKMISCASFRKNGRDKCWEISRFASDYNYHVHGALGKILKKYKKEYESTLISFSNNRLSNGNIYKKLGFKEITVTKDPSYWYTDFKIRLFRTKCKRINDPEILKKYPTEIDQALGGIFSQKYLGHSRPLYKIYDYGHRKWTIE